MYLFSIRLDFKYDAALFWEKIQKEFAKLNLAAS